VNGTGIGLARLNDAPAQEAARLLATVCASPAWAADVTAGRPYRDLAAACRAAGRATLRLAGAEVDAALDGHARIGRPRGDDERSMREQRGAVAAGDEVRRALEEANRRYERRFGRVFLVCAAGLTGEQLLAALHRRLDNPPEVEHQVLLRELARINELRLRQLVGP
jgi:2-oxo-4-hydroxy-4-carboxy-5-ureidoimidazoline decarboxylase